MKNIKNRLSALLVFIYIFTNILSPLSILAAGQDNKKEAPKEKTELLVKFKDDSKADNSRSKVKSKLKIGKLDSKARSKKSRIELLEINEGDDLNAVIKELKKDSNVLFAQPNYKLSATAAKSAAVPRDELFPQQWGLFNNGQKVEFSTGKAGQDISALAAWGLTKGSAVLVGVLDTGIDTSHEDLKDNIYVNSNEIKDNGIDDDGNGYIDDINGWDFANGDNSVFDDTTSDMHGTQVAGVIAAGENGTGIVGAAPKAALLPLKFINGTTGYTSDAIEAIEYASRMGVKIVNCSFSGSSSNPALKEAMAESGMLFVCAAGNEGRDLSKSPVYPAGFELSNILTVGAQNNKGQMAALSNYGINVDVAAPGIDILTTQPQDKYEYKSGTSFAAPYVSAVAALLQSLMPDMTAAQLATRIKSTAAKSEETTGKVAYGRVDANAALTNNQSSSTDIVKKPAADTRLPADESVVAVCAATIAPELLEQIHYGETGVNAATGNYSKTDIDMSEVSPGFTVNMSRTYNSKDDRATSTMGRGWTFGFEGSLKKDANYASNSVLVAKLPNGSAQVFIDNRNGTYAANDSRSTLVKNQDGTTTLTTKDQYTYIFNTTAANPEGYLTEMRDRNKNSLKISLDAAVPGKVLSVTDTVGRQFGITYDTNNLITKISDIKGKRYVKYEYSSAKLLTTVSAITLEGADSPAIYSYEYDASNYLTKVRDALKNTLEQVTYDHAAGTNQHKVTKSTDQNGNTFNYTYDPGNRTTTIKDSSTPSAITVTKKYDTAYYITESIDPEGKSTTVEYYLDTNNYNKYGEEKKIKDRNGNVTEYARDERGNITKILNPDKSTREYTYDAQNNTTAEKDETGRATYYIYDDTGRLLKKVQPLNGTDTYDPNADQSKYSVTKYAYYTNEEAQALGYKAKGLLKQTADPAGGVTKYEYDADGNQTAVTDPEGNTTKNEYNALGWLTQKTSPSGYTVTYTYDAYGRVVKTELDKGETSRTVYDLLGRKIQDIAPNQYEEEKDGLNSGTPTQTYADVTAGTRYEYNPAGRVKKVTDPMDSSVEYTYDIYGNTLSEKLTDSTGKEKNTKSYTYDVMNRLTTVSFKGGSDQTSLKLESYAYTIQTDGKTQKTHTRYLNTAAPAITGTTTSEAAITEYTYDYANRQVEQKNPDGGRLTTIYNPNGTIASTTDAMGNTTWYKYDGRNNPSEKWIPMEEGLYSYTRIAYDKAGRKVSEQTGKDKTELYGIPSSDRLITKSYAYDKNGSLTTVTDSSGRRTENQYDPEGNLVRENIFTAKDTFNTTEYTYNHIGKVTSRTKYIKKGDLLGNKEENQEQEALTTTCKYDKNGNLIEEKTPDGVITSYTYDLLGRQTETRKLEIDEHGLPVIASTKTAYDSQGNIIATTDAKGITTTYHYDDRGLMQQSKKTTIETTSAGSITIDHITACYYDLAGRKTAEVSPENYVPAVPYTQMNRTEYVYDKMGRLKAKIQVYKVKDEENFTTLVSAAYKYDKNGNPIKELDGEGYSYGVGTTLEEKIYSGYGMEKTYNQAGLLETELDPAAKADGLKNTKKNTYDGAGRKISETDARGVITSYYYDDAGNLVTTAVRKTQSDAELVTGTKQYDLAGNITEKTDGNGNATKYQYNSLNKLKKIQYPSDETIPGYTETYQYDQMGNIRKKEDSMGVQNLYTYDNEGRMLSQTQQDSKGRDKITTFAAYDLNGNKTKETDGNGTEKENRYDEKNRLIEQKTNITGINNKTVTYKTQNKYDKNNNLLEQTSYIDGVLTGKTATKYDALNRSIEKRDAYNIIQTLEYDKSHRQTKATDANGNETKYTYDRNNRLTATTDPEGNITRQSYDGAGNLTEKTDGNGNKTTYSYDQFGRLLQVTNAKGEKTGYTYDACGNLLTQTDGRGNTTAYEYNAANKETRKIYPGGKKTIEGTTVYDPAKTETYTYNANGTAATKTDRNGKTTSYKNDIHGRV
ncbi:S8 family serine peptidase, partial [Ruminiclostridium hungatei]|uniref:S8 family serine peptidase n=1 Tax=Ruminiclostridium hungatei TaxID=48256 RepID=UPI0009AECFF1